MLQYPLATMDWMAAQLPDDFTERAGGLVDQIRDNPTLAAILAVIGVLTAVLFVWGIIRQAFKAALLGAVLSAGAWYWFFNLR